jgi:hypothetical protein
MAEEPERDATLPLADIASISDAARIELLEHHPIREREYILPTPMMERTYKIIREVVWARRTGSVFYASPRTGKTRCAFGAKISLEAEFPKTFVSLLSARRTRQASASHMCRLILEAEHHALSSRPDAALLFSNALADIEIKTKSKGGAQFVLLIDEIQLLNQLDLEQLFCFHNALELRKIRMTTISFAQPEIVHLRSALLASHDTQIIARFLSDLVHFEGCSSMKDLTRILESYDINSEFPDGSGWSYTRFFAPIAFKNGFLLERYADTIWSELNNANSGAGTLPMEHTCLTVEYLLLQIWKRDCFDLTLSKKDISTAVLASGLQNFNSVMVDEYESPTQNDKPKRKF